MVKEQILNETLVRHYSDEGKKIRQIETDIIYDEAIDIIPCRYTYEQTDIPGIDQINQELSAEEIEEALNRIIN